MLRILSALAVVCLLSLSQSAAIAADKDPIMVGSVLDETGGLNVYGKTMADATRLAVKSINESGGVLGRPAEITQGQYGRAKPSEASDPAGSECG